PSSTGRWCWRSSRRPTGPRSRCSASTAPGGRSATRTTPRRPARASWRSTPTPRPRSRRETAVRAAEPVARIGVFGGTFDPPHVGHLIVAQELVDRLELDRLLLIPAGDPPHKPDGAEAPAAVRAR